MSAVDSSRWKSPHAVTVWRERDSVFWRTLFTRHPHSSAKLGNYHCNNRVYSIGTGRWLSPDQAASPFFNLFEYCNSNGLQMSDPTGLKSYQIETKCGVLVLDLETKFLELASAHAFRSVDELLGVQVNGRFLPNGSCCCWQWNVVLFERKLRLTPNKNRPANWINDGPGGDQSPAHYRPSDEGWHVGTDSDSWIMGHSPMIGDRCNNTATVYFGDLPGWHISELRRQIQRENSSDKWYQRIRTLKFELVFCAVCDGSDSHFGGCISVTFTAGAGAVTLQRPKTHDDPAFFNDHPARKAWNKAEEKQIPGAGS